MAVRAVDQNRQLLRADLLSSVSEHKQHGVDHVGLAAAVWPDDAGKTLITEQVMKTVSGYTSVTALKDCGNKYLNTLLMSD